jgi:hypothetical protein
MPSCVPSNGSLGAGKSRIAPVRHFGAHVIVKLECHSSVDTFFLDLNGCAQARVQFPMCGVRERGDALQWDF